MPYSVRIAKSAAKAIKRLPKPAAKRVVDAIERLADRPRPRGCKKLAGEESIYRVRVGEYRVIYEVDDDRVTVLVVRVRHRRDAY